MYYTDRLAVLTNLELLRTFLVAADAQTFREAAARRHVTRSAVSQQIKQLEDQLGVALFERAGRRALLTESGKALAEALRSSFETIDEAIAAVASGHRDVSGEVTVGAPGPFTRLWLRPRIVRLLKAHGGLRLVVSFGTPRELERRLADRALDLVILVRPVELPGINAVPIFTETFRAYAAPSYLKSSALPRNVADLQGHRFIVYDADLPMHGPWWRAKFGGRTPFRGKVVCRTASLYEMLALAEEGIGIVVLPDYFAGEAARRGTIVELPSVPGSRPSTATNKILLASRQNVVPTARFRIVHDGLLE
jgi:LysR family glycine cleavage system transcriptional activator